MKERCFNSCQLSQMVRHDTGGGLLGSGCWALRTHLLDDIYGSVPKEAGSVILQHHFRSHHMWLMVKEARGVPQDRKVFCAVLCSPLRLATDPTHRYDGVRRLQLSGMRGVRRGAGKPSGRGAPVEGCVCAQYCFQSGATVQCRRLQGWSSCC